MSILLQDDLNPLYNDFSMTNCTRLSKFFCVAYHYLQVDGTNKKSDPQEMYHHERSLILAFAEQVKHRVYSIVYMGEIIFFELLDTEGRTDYMSEIIAKLNLPLVQRQSGTFDSKNIFTSTSKITVLAYLNFLKSVKKTTIRNMCLKLPMVPFCNQVITWNELGACEIAYFNFFVSQNNELMVSSSLSREISLAKLTDSTSLENKTVYIAPSGIRCELAVASSFADSLSPVAPANSDDLLLLLKENYGIALAKDVQWVRLVPNLDHFNNMTPKISSYLSTMPSSKFIIWPSALCFTQEGDKPPSNSLAVTDPLSLVNDVIELEMLLSDSHTKPVDSPFPPPPLTATTDITTPACSASDDPTPAASLPKDEDWDELFEDAERSPQEDEFELFDELINEDTERGRDQIDYERRKIKLEQMSPGATSYMDPGAPSPGPLTIIASVKAQTPTRPELQELKEELRKKSVFAPLTFNPIIGTKIDSKYASGGKFFFEDGDSSTIDMKDAHAILPGDVDNNDLLSDSSEEVDYEDDDEEEGYVSETNNPLNDLEGTVPILRSPSLDYNSKRLTVSQEPSFQEHENLSWLPFVLKSMPISSIPTRFSICAQVVARSEIQDVLPILQSFIANDAFCSLSDTEKVHHLSRSNQHRLVNAQLTECLSSGHSGSLPVRLASLLGLEPSFSQKKSSILDPSFDTASPATPLDSLNTCVPEETREEPTALFRIPQPRLSVRRGGAGLGIAASGMSFWDTLGLEPLDKQVTCSILLVAPKIPECEAFAEATRFVFMSVVNSFESHRLGSMKTLDTISEVGMQDGILEIESELSSPASYWACASDQLAQLGTSYKSHLPFPLLLLMADPFSSLDSLVGMARSASRFKQSISEAECGTGKKRKTEPGVISCQFPVSLYFGQNGQECILSEGCLSVLSRSLYRQAAFGRNIFNASCAILRKPPTKIQFQLTKTHVSSSLTSPDLYIHLCYERSIDRKWCVAAWSDQFGDMRNLQTFCDDVTPFEQVSNELWETTLEMIKSHRGKCFLVLTRLNNTLPDDELIQWKRLSLKCQSVRLIVVTLNLSSSLTLQALERGKSVTTPATPLDLKSPICVEDDTLGEVVDISHEAYGIVLPFPIPLSNQSNRLPIRSGYLYRAEGEPGARHRNLLEINLLSCPNSLNASDILRTVIVHYRNLSELSSCWGFSECENFQTGLTQHLLIPWHALCVRKLLSVVVHFSVKE